MSALPERCCEFGGPSPMRDRLVKAVLNGDRAATSSSLREWQAEGEQLPEVGERQAVVHSAERPVAVIEIVGVEIIRLGDADWPLRPPKERAFARSTPGAKLTKTSGRRAKRDLLDARHHRAAKERAVRQKQRRTNRSPSRYCAASRATSSSGSLRRARRTGLQACRGP